MVEQPTESLQMKDIAHFPLVKDLAFSVPAKNAQYVKAVLSVMSRHFGVKIKPEKSTCKNKMHHRC